MTSHYIPAKPRSTDLSQTQKITSVAPCDAKREVVGLSAMKLGKDLRRSLHGRTKPIFRDWLAQKAELHVALSRILLMGTARWQHRYTKTPAWGE